MDPKVEALASRLKSALDQYEAGRQRELAAREQALARARAARSALFEELAAFGRAVGHLRVEAGEDRLSLAWRASVLEFEAEGPGDAVRVRFGAVDQSRPDSPVRIGRSPSGVWMLAVAHDGVEDVEPLFERGLVHLLIEGLGVPLDQPDEPGRAHPPLDDLVPGDD